MNEDAYCVLTAPAITQEIDALLVAADGMGGHQAGEVASGYVVETLQQLFSSPIYRQWVDYSPKREDYYAAVLKEVMERLNDRLYTLASTQKDLSGMGTTATVALLTGERLFIGHVGDSRAYLLRNGQMKQLTHDHSWVEQQVQAGAMTPEEAESHPRKNVLTQALGTSLLVRVERSIHPVRPNDVLILCTDGLTNAVSAAEIRQMIQSHRDPQEACDALVDLANRRGGPDNITVLIARLTAEAKRIPLRKERAPARRREAEESIDTQKIPRRKLKKKGRPRNLVEAFLLGVIALMLIGGALRLLVDSDKVIDEVQPVIGSIGVAAGMTLLFGLGMGIVLEMFLSSLKGR